MFAVAPRVFYYHTPGSFTSPMVSPSEFFFDVSTQDSKLYSHHCECTVSVVWTVLDCVNHHSPCVNTQATYSMAKPIKIIVNADVIMCVFNSIA